MITVTMGARPTRTLVVVVTFFAAAILLAGCAAGPNPSAGGGEAGFWFGLWHGLIAPVAFVISLVRDGVGIYEVQNSGAWYDFGFVVGLGFLVGGGSSAGR
ncbi:MAG: hypothetical protein WD638_08580 [Nitriliruptoraceae bacterium]